MKKACLTVFLSVLVTVIMASALQAAEAGWDELDKKARSLLLEKKYSEAIKTYEELLLLAQKNYGKKNVKAAEILIEMSLIHRYNLNDEKGYRDLQEEAKKIRMTLNGTLDCDEPAKWAYEQCQERWLGSDPCFKFTDYRNYIKVTYYGLEGSAFREPEDLIGRLKGLFGKFEAMDTVRIDWREAVRIKLRYDERGSGTLDGKAMIPEFRYEEFILVPLAQGFLAFNFNMSSHIPIPAVFSREGAPRDRYANAYDNYQTWSSFIDSCSVSNRR